MAEIHTYWLWPSLFLVEPPWEIARQESSVSGQNEHAEAYALRLWAWDTESFHDSASLIPRDFLPHALCLTLPEDRFPQLAAEVRRMGRKFTDGVNLLRSGFRHEIIEFAANLEKGDE